MPADLRIQRTPGRIALVNARLADPPGLDGKGGIIIDDGRSSPSGRR